MRFAGFVLVTNLGEAKRAAVKKELVVKLRILLDYTAY